VDLPGSHSRQQRRIQSTHQAWGGCVRARGGRHRVGP
jgi:hypothetical protein